MSVPAEKEDIFDIAVVGLGPAGSTFARLVSSRFKIAVFDMKQSDPVAPGFRKPCGGLLAEDAQLALSRQNLTLPKSVLADPQIFSVKTIDLAQNLVRTYRRFYINMDRHKFDLWLKSLVPAHVERHDSARVKKILRGNDGVWEVTFHENGTEKILRSRTLVGADGAASLVRHTLFPNHKIRSYTAVQQWFEDKQSAPLYACFFDSRITDSYGWAVSKDGQLVFGAAFPRENSSKAYELLLERAKAFGFVLENPLRTEACQVLRPERFRDFKIGTTNAFLLGEAAGFISPSSLEGMSYALDSAEMLANAFNEQREFFPALVFESYEKQTLKIRLKLLSKILKNPFMYNPKVRSIVMKSGIASIKVNPPKAR